VLEALRTLAGVQDAVVSERHALVVFDPAARPAGVEEAIERAISNGRGATPSVPREHRVGVRYDGADLDEVAALAGIGREEAAVLHAAGDYVVAAVGFLPGFAYLRGLDPRLAVTRRAVPRTRVPALSVAVAGPYSGVYPFASPGGWNIVGTAVGFVPFDARQGATFALGDRVRFHRVSP
jgi:UPF0271 protein